MESSESFNGGFQNEVKAVFCKANQLLFFRQTALSEKQTGDLS